MPRITTNDRAAMAAAGGPEMAFDQAFLGGFLRGRRLLWAPGSILSSVMEAFTQVGSPSNLPRCPHFIGPVVPRLWRSVSGLAIRICPTFQEYQIWPGGPSYSNRRLSVIHQ